MSIKGDFAQSVAKRGGFVTCLISGQSDSGYLWVFYSLGNNTCTCTSQASDCITFTKFLLTKANYNYMAKPKVKVGEYMLLISHQAVTGLCIFNTTG